MKRLLYIIYVLIFLVLLATLLIDKPNTNNVSPIWYNDLTPDNDKHHPIIRIQKKKIKPTDKNNVCSAFVINDTMALTAAHCMGLTLQQIDTINKLSTIKEQKLLELITYLESTCKNGPLCLKQLEYAEYQLSRELKDREISLSVDPTEYYIKNIDGEDVGTGVASYKDLKRDFGFIKGDFKNFNKVLIERGWTVQKGDMLKACGFYGGKIPPVCVDFQAVGSWNFQYRGYSMFEPGVSGGPVFNKYGNIVGIASQVMGGHALIEPILGVLSLDKPEEEEDNE